MRGRVAATTEQNQTTRREIRMRNPSMCKMQHWQWGLQPYTDSLFSVACSDTKYVILSWACTVCKNCLERIPVRGKQVNKRQGCSETQSMPLMLQPFTVLVLNFFITLLLTVHTWAHGQVNRSRHVLTHNCISCSLIITFCNSLDKTLYQPFRRRYFNSIVHKSNFLSLCCRLVLIVLLDQDTMSSKIYLAIRSGLDPARKCSCMHDILCRRAVKFVLTSM